MTEYEVRIVDANGEVAASYVVECAHIGEVNALIGAECDGAVLVRPLPAPPLPREN